MTTTVTPQTFAAAVQHVSDLAHAKLAPEWHGRLGRATALVQQGFVDFEADGTCHVLSSDKGTWYLVNSHCECEAQQFHREDYWCAHRVARALAIKARALCAQQTAVEASQSPQVDTSPPEALGDTSDDQDPAWTALATTRPQISPTEAHAEEENAQEGKKTCADTLQPDVSNFALLEGKNWHVHSGLPEARASANCYVLINGGRVQVTLRDHDEAALLTRLAAVLQQYPIEQATAPRGTAPQGQSQGQHPRCPVHPSRTMKEFPSKPGQFHCTHKDAASGVYCTERA